MSTASSSNNKKGRKAIGWYPITMQPVVSADKPRSAGRTPECPSEALDTLRFAFFGARFKGLRLNAS